MKKTAMAMACCFLAVCLSSCGPKKAVSSSEAIKISDTMQTTEQKADYLLAQAKAFYNSKEYDAAIRIAERVPTTIEKYAAEARKIIEKARKEMTEMAQKEAQRMKGTMEGMGR